MDLDTSTELPLTPSVSFSTSVSSSTADVFSLLLTQLQQCHTQRITELEQKVNHLNKKCQKLFQLSKEQKEVALKYRKTCQELKKENHALKKELKEGNRKHFKVVYADSSSESTLPREDQTGNDRKSPQKHSKSQDFVEPDKSPSSKAPPVSSKLSRLKKKNRKVRYAEVSIPPRDEVSSKPSSSREEKKEPLIVVPETMDPDLDLEDENADGSISSSQNLADASSKMQTESKQSLLEKPTGDSESNGSMRNGIEEDEVKTQGEGQNVAASHLDLEESHLPSSENRRCERSIREVAAGEHVQSRDVTPKDASTPVDKVRIQSFTERPSISMDGMTMSPLILDEINFNGDFGKSQQQSWVETENLADNSHTQMSPTFIGGKGLPNHPPSLAERFALPSLPPDWTPKDKSVSRTFDGTVESEASFLLLQQNVSSSPKVVSSSVTKKSPSKARIFSRAIKRKVSPDKRLSKVRKVSINKVSCERKPGMIRHFTSHVDTKRLDELKRLKQSTLSQHVKPISDTKQKVISSTEVKKNGFKLPNVPSKTRRSESHEENVETNAGVSLNGSIDPIIDLDDYDGDIEPLEYIPSPTAKESDSYRENIDVETENSKKKMKECNSIQTHSPVADNSDVMFDCSFGQEDGDATDISFSRPENGLNERQILAMDFDRVPKKEDCLQFKFKEVVRKHNEREQLKGFDCKQCAEFYNGMRLTDSQKEERMKLCSRHRGRYTPPSTPEHYWSIGFPDTMTCLERGYIQEDRNSKVDADVMPRRRLKLAQLFSKEEKK